MEEEENGGGGSLGSFELSAVHLRWWPVRRAHEFLPSSNKVRGGGEMVVAGRLVALSF